jgi:hypothetical protein
VLDGPRWQWQNKVKEVIGYYAYYRKDCGVEEADMYDEATGLPDDKSHVSVLQLSLIPEIEGWVARSVEYTPEQIDQRKNRTEGEDLGGLTVAQLKAVFKELELDTKTAFPGKTVSSLKQKDWLDAFSAELVRKQQGEDDQLWLDTA